ncbi:MAG: phosphatase PAP2 family protein [Oscillospiraceae bacterium]
MITVDDWKKITIIEVALLAFQCAIYYGLQFIQGEPHVLGGALDLMIPFVPIFIYPYLLWFAVLFLMVIILYVYSKEALIKYITATAIIYTIAAAIYLIYPTTFVRTAQEVGGVTGYLIELTYGMDYRHLNCAPSLHCAMSYLFIMSILQVKKAPIAIKVFIIFMALLIVASTLLVKQHVVADAVSALPVAVAGWALSGLILSAGKKSPHKLSANAEKCA